MKPSHEKRKHTKDILFIVAIILSVIFFYIGLHFFLATDTPLIALSTGSMSPALEPGDLLIVKGIQPENIKVGDIIVFDPPEEGIGRTIHRVNATQPLTNGTLTFKTKGDANSDIDPYTVYPQTIHGQVIYRIPYIGYIFLDPLILIIIITIIVILIIIWPEKKGRFNHKHKTHSLKTGLT
jgi:signal peptidase